MTLSLYRKYASFFLSKEVESSLGERERERERRWVTAILTQNFFSWPCHAVLSSRPYVSSLTRRTQQGVACGPLAPGQAWLSNYRLLNSGDKIPVSQVGICIYHFTTPMHFRSTTWLLPLIYIGSSCADKSLIDGSVKGQYATRMWSICSFHLLPPNPSLTKWCSTC